MIRGVNMENAITLAIHGIYLATEGEGILVGTPRVFVRFQGCKIACRNCDSKDTWKFDSRFNRSLNDVYEKILEESFNGSVKQISITGGDPLDPYHRLGLLKLIEKLKEGGFIINLEAAGTEVIDEVFDIVDFISFDIKTPSTNVLYKEVDLKKVLIQYKNKIQIKAVIENKVDFDFVANLYRKYGTRDVTWCLTPSYPQKSSLNKELILSVMGWNYQAGGHFRVIAQQHKFIFGPDRTDT